MMRDVERGIPDMVRRARAEMRARFAREGYHQGRTLAQVLDDGARTRGDTVLRFHSAVRPTVITLAELHRRATRVAAGLSRLGLHAGDVIALQLPNWVELAVSYYAAARLGLVIVPIVPIYGAAEVGFILRDSRARAVMLPTDWRAVDYFGNLSRCGPLPDLQHAIAVGDSIPPGALGWESLEMADAPSMPPAVTDADDVCMIVYTSGTTTDPKGVQHSHNSVVAEMRWSPAPPPLAAPGTVSLQPFPPGHTAGVIGLLGPAVHGFDTILMDMWDAEVAVELVQLHGVGALNGTPYFLDAMLDVSERDGWAPTRSIRDVITGGAGVPPALVERGAQAGWVVARVYGATEHPSVTGGGHDDSLALRANTDGMPLHGNVVVIVDKDGRAVPAGVDGEITVSGPEQFVSYTDASLNATAFTDSGFFRTGDVGHLDAAGALTVTDRIKDVIIRGGENISSRNVEEVLRRHPDVSDVAVTGYPDPRYGERVAAFVVLRSGRDLDIDGVRAHFRANGVAMQKTPERLITVASLPRTAAGKVKKHELKRRYLDSSGAVS
jgi:acyl-CoA synthetase (AMP-forming)/AMP-acid ligase II